MYVSDDELLANNVKAHIIIAHIMPYVVMYN